jgi:hypothetical protein
VQQDRHGEAARRPDSLPRPPVEDAQVRGARPGEREDRPQHPELLKRLREALPEAPAAYPADQLTDRDERFFAAELLREKLFEETGRGAALPLRSA